MAAIGYWKDNFNFLCCPGSRKKKFKFLAASNKYTQGWSSLNMTKCHSIRHQTPKFPTPPKSYATFFLGYSGPYFGPTNTNHTKNYQNITFGALFRLPPQNALQCTTVHYSALQCSAMD